MMIGIAICANAEKEGGPIPVLIRFSNPQEKLRCGIPVQVRMLGDMVTKD